MERVLFGTCKEFSAFYFLLYYKAVDNGNTDYPDQQNHHAPHHLQEIVKQQETPISTCAYGTVLMSQGEQKCIGKYIEGNHKELNRTSVLIHLHLHRVFEPKERSGANTKPLYCV